MQFQVNIPTNIFIGENVIETLPIQIKSLYKNLLIISSVDLKDQVDNTINILSELSCDIDLFLMDATEPTTDQIDSKAIVYRKNNYDLIIGIGGGSAIDMAKALAIALKNPEPIWNYANLSNRPPSKLKDAPLPVIALPTTSGTGSEVTPYAVLTKTETQQKGTIQEREIFPMFAIIEPSFLMTMPAELTAYTGMDAFAHAFESYINISKISPVAELVATHAIELIFKNLKNACDNPTNIDARLNMAWASTLAGIAISHRGTTTPHAIAEPLGTLTKLPHAITVCLCTVPVLKHSYEVLREKLNDLIKKINFVSDSNTKNDFIEILDSLVEDIGCTKKLIDFIKIDNNLNIELIENVLRYKFRPLKKHPVIFTERELANVVKDIVYA